MSRRLVALDGGRRLLVGYDRPFRTLYAQLFDGTDKIPDEPSRVMGYHPMEQGLNVPAQGIEYGPYPVDISTFDRVLVEWGLTEQDRDRAGAALARDVKPEDLFDGCGGVL